MEVRMGIEPWHVLGEEMSSSGTARFVDSSLEKIQVKLKRITPGRHQLFCNGYPVPLQSTKIKDEMICGIRYRAWQPPSALHPTIGVDAPLTLDLVDNWNGRSIGGCTYHVSHPGGRNYETYPINSFEAESRRISRYWDQGFSQETIRSAPWVSMIEHYIKEDRKPMKVDTPAPVINPDYPCTLDLRRLNGKKKFF